MNERKKNVFLGNIKIIAFYRNRYIHKINVDHQLLATSLKFWKKNFFLRYQRKFL